MKIFRCCQLFQFSFLECTANASGSLSIEFGSSVPAHCHDVSCLQAVHASEWEAGIVWGSDSETEPQPAGPSHEKMHNSISRPTSAPGHSVLLAATSTAGDASGFGDKLPDMHALLTGHKTDASVSELRPGHLGSRVQRPSLVDVTKVAPLPSGMRQSVT